MPTENELKFVLNLNCESKIIELADERIDIIQGYLATSKGMGLRIRKQNEDKRIFTFKQKVNGRVIEIEKSIDERDFDDLWNVALNKLVKQRYKINNGDHVWEIDFFKDRFHHTYFAQAEVEMPEGQKAPTSIPFYISDNLIYAVPEEDDRFGSKKLANARYAQKTLEELIHGNSIA